MSFVNEQCGGSPAFPSIPVREVVTPGLPQGLSLPTRIRKVSLELFLLRLPAFVFENMRDRSHVLKIARRHGSRVGFVGAVSEALFL